MQKVLPCVSFLVSCIMKKLKEEGKLYEFSKKKNSILEAI